MPWLVVLALLLFIPAPLRSACPPAWEAAQPRCRTGCPCGNACISCSKTCRIASTPPRTTTPARPAPATTPPPARSTNTAVAPLMSPSAAPPDTATGWIGSGLNRLYFKRSCALTSILIPSDRLLADDTTFFASQGWKRLVAEGC